MNPQAYEFLQPHRKIKVHEGSILQHKGTKHFVQVVLIQKGRIAFVDLTTKEIGSVTPKEVWEFYDRKEPGM